ncbi:uncharacterized protein LOC102458237 [Pelodiscus sinensis]|uniref:uncharacterized protein LOC102458237 n=1 Tax=Pelodiscus sinensis TaxID=13735 RepID=UPI003F6A73BE
MGVSLLLCLLPALLATASAQAGTLTCKMCFGSTETCSLLYGTCQDDPATGGCLSVAEETSLNGTVKKFFSRQCFRGYNNQLNVPLTFSVGNGQRVIINVTQCNTTDLCNSALPQVSPDTTPNGRQCPTCFALNSDTCNSVITPCTGLETYCLDSTGELSDGSSSSPFAAKGCASASAERVKRGTTLVTAAYKLEFSQGSIRPAKAEPATAGPLTCDVCIGPTAACDLFEDTCQDDPATGGCLSVAEETSLDGRKDTFFRKQCLSSYKNPIKSPISFTVGADQYVRLNVTQCNDKDKCNSATLQELRRLEIELRLKELEEQEEEKKRQARDKKRQDPGTQTCNVCFGYTAACDLFQATCQSDQATGGCISVAGETSLNGTKDTFFSSQCLSGYKSDIKVPITFSLGNGQYVRNNVTQCNTDLCNSALPQAAFPKENTTPNGLQCPTCFALNFAACNSQITPCTGQETYCLNYFGFLTQATDTTTPDKKTIHPATDTTKNTMHSVVTSTTKGGSPALGKVPFALYLPALMGLLLVKLLS